MIIMYIYVYICICIYIIYISRHICHIYIQYIHIVCDHEIIQAMQFAETSFEHSCINGNLQNFTELLTVTHGF